VKSVLGEFSFGVSICRNKGSLVSYIWGPLFARGPTPGGTSSGSGCSTKVKKH